MRTTELETTAEMAIRMGLTTEEFEKIGEVLGRMPNPAELSVYSVMWSESCSQKSSIKWLKTLPRDGEHLLRGPAGDGLVDLGGGLACAFKIEPNKRPGHNLLEENGMGFSGMHQCTAALGARPVAAFHSLYIGDPNLESVQKNFSEALKNSKQTAGKTGVPNLGGEVFFHAKQMVSLCSLSLGIVETDKIVSPHAGAPGNPVYVLGRAVACQNSDENLPEEKLGAGEGSIFPEKRLVEACLEAAQSGAVAGMHNIGEAGIAFSAAKICAKGSFGMTIDLDKMPTPKGDVEKLETLPLGSPGLMMVVAKAGEEDALFEIFGKWEVPFVQVGAVTDKGALEFHQSGERLAEVPVGTLLSGGGAPIYDHKLAKPDYLKKVKRFQLNQIRAPKDYIKVAKQLWASPNLAFRNWYDGKKILWGQCEEMTAEGPSDAEVVKLTAAGRTVLANVGGNPSYLFAAPYAGAGIAVAGAARRIYCAGGLPVAINARLNFGEADDPEVYYQFTNAVKGMGDACRKFSIPVSECKASFSEEKKVGDAAEPTFPTPIIGMIGILAAPEDHTSIGYKNEGDCIYLIGNSENDLGSSEFLRSVHGIEFSPAPKFEPHEELEIHAYVHNLIRMNIVASAHSVSIGGLFVNLLESALAGGLGFSIETVETFRKDCFLFGESQSRAVVSISPGYEDALLNYLISNNVSFTKLGEVLGKDVIIDGENFGSINDWKTVNDNKFDKILERKDG